jgi:glycolate oxidase FAD binding subunit
LSVQEQAQRVLEIGHALDLSAQIYEEQDETQHWQTWQHQIWEPHPQKTICKLGIRPTEAVNLLLKIQQLVQVQSECVIHARTGLGVLRCHQIRSTQLLELRSHITSHGGFLTVLEAPRSLKQSLDVWGYTGNARKIMKDLKYQFDPDSLLSCDRFIQ